MERFLQAAREKNFSVYVGLVTHDNTINPADDSDKGRLIDFSIRIANKLMKLCEDKGWGWVDNFIKGLYIPQELDVDKFYTGPPDGSGPWTEYFNYYVDLSKMLRNNTVGISKKIMLCPYVWEYDDYQRIYDNIFHAVKYTDIDIFAPQDSVGSKKTTRYIRDREHFDALADAVRNANTSLHKRVEAWVDMETFTKSWDGMYFPPTDFKTLRWQIRAVESVLPNTISWMHQWAMSDFAGLPNVPPYY